MSDMNNNDKQQGRNLTRRLTAICGPTTTTAWQRGEKQQQQQQQLNSTIYRFNRPSGQ
jgi:hypothetical protein